MSGTEDGSARYHGSLRRVRFLDVLAFFSWISGEARSLSSTP